MYTIYKKKQEKKVCPYCFQKEQQHKKEYKIWEEALKDKVVFDTSGKPL